MTTLAAQATACDALWYTRCPVPTALGIAVHRGWFDEEFGPDGITLNSLQETADAGKRESHFDLTCRTRSGRAATFRRCGRGRAAPIRA